MSAAIKLMTHAMYALAVPYVDNLVTLYWRTSHHIIITEYTASVVLLKVFGGSLMKHFATCNFIQGLMYSGNE